MLCGDVKLRQVFREASKIEIGGLSLHARLLAASGCFWCPDGPGPQDVWGNSRSDSEGDSRGDSKGS